MDKATHDKALKQIMLNHSCLYKNQLEQRLKTIRQTYQLGQTISGPDHDLLIALLPLHPYYHSYKPTRFTITEYGAYRSRCIGFNVDNDPNKVHVFSTSSCLNNAEYTKKHNIQMTFRALAMNDIVEFRAREMEKYINVSFTCPFTRKQYEYNTHNVHIDHDKHELPFVKMVQDFKTLNNLEDTDLNNAIDEQTGTRVFTNRLINLGWQEYHHSNASLQSISREANLSNKY